MNLRINEFLKLGLRDVDPKDVDVEKGVERLQVSISRAGASAGMSLAKVPLSSLCTSACFSTISSLTVNSARSRDVSNEDLRNLVALHQKAVDAVGEFGFIQAAERLGRESSEGLLRELELEDVNFLAEPETEPER